MRPPRSLPAVLSVIALLALPAIAEPTPAPVREVGVQAKVLSINKKNKRIRARVLTASGDVGEYKDKTLRFDVRGARMTVADTNGDGRANTLADIRRNDIVGITGTAPSGRVKVVTVTTLTDVTALLPAQGVPPTPTLPGTPQY